MDAQRRRAALAALDAVVGTVAARNHRGVAMGLVASAVRARTGLGLGEWAVRLAYPTWVDLVRALPCVRALVPRGADWDLLPATVLALPSHDAPWHRVPSPPPKPNPKPIIPTPAVVRTARQCRKAVADLRRFPFVSLVVDASTCHDLGMIYLGARESDGRRAVCYAFDVHATAPATEWQGVAQIFGAGGLAWFLGDPAVPKAVCGGGPGHDSVAHAATRDLAQLARVPTADGATMTNLLVRSVVRALPPPPAGLAPDSGNGSTGAAQDAAIKALHAHGFDMALWAQAGAASNGYRWYWLRRPLSPHTLANGAERAMMLCVAYEAMQKASVINEPGPPSAATPITAVTDSLLCVAAAQTAACNKWPLPVAPRGDNRQPNRDSDLPLACPLDNLYGKVDDRRIAVHAKQKPSSLYMAKAVRTDAGARCDVDGDSDWDDLWRAVQHYMAASAASDSYASAAADGCRQDIPQGAQRGDQPRESSAVDGGCDFCPVLLPSPLWAYDGPRCPNGQNI
ncbi:hypothetical protein pclt_cds_907 [Pandoravirus celtis]|uniref:Uncharacterized protein n=1 Tax=Pandoravirus celtis TaxID=2568002 RepID=A0A4D6EJK6_9VIRU|nr:hypothetical protein pclt_cds_907 [Pandoravirus celtis]